MADNTVPQPEATPPAKKGGKRTVLFGAIVFLLLGGGAGAYWYTRGDAKSAPDKKEAEPDHSGVVSFEPIVVNLADGAGARFLRVSVQLVIPGESEAEEVDKDPVRKARLRAKLLELLSQQTSERLVTADGKAALKTAIIASASEVVAPTKVSDVLFTDFIVQF